MVDLSLRRSWICCRYFHRIRCSRTILLCNNSCKPLCHNSSAWLVFVIGYDNSLGGVCLISQTLLRDQICSKGPSASQRLWPSLRGFRRNSRLAVVLVLLNWKICHLSGKISVASCSDATQRCQVITACTLSLDRNGYVCWPCISLLISLPEFVEFS